MQPRVVALRDYPGIEMLKRRINPNGVASVLRYLRKNDATPLGLDIVRTFDPRVAAKRGNPGLST